MIKRWYFISAKKMQINGSYSTIDSTFYIKSLFHDPNKALIVARDFVKKELEKNSGQGIEIISFNRI